MLYKKLILTMLTILATSMASAAGTVSYQVTVTNITPGQTFTPILVTSHNRTVSLFELGEPASEELATLAEGGDTGPLTTLLQSAGHAVADVQTIGGLLAPGQTTSITITANRFHRKLSLAAMLIPTNDSFVALNKVSLPLRGSRSYFAKAYDAGSEANDQSCANIPGPRCGGAGPSPQAAEGDEGFVHIANGFHELGDFDELGAEILSPEKYDWRNPVAKVTIKRLSRYSY